MTETLRAERNAELLALVEACCNGSLTDAEFARFEQRLTEDAAARAFYRRYANLHSALQEYGDVTGPGWYAASIDELNAASRSRRVKWIATACATVCLLLAAVLLVVRPPDAGEMRPIVGTLEAHAGTVTLASNGIERVAGASGERVRDGDTIRTTDADSSVTLKHNNGSRFTLSSGTVLACGDREMAIRRGVVRSNVVLRPDDGPLAMTTPRHTLSVRQGEFELRATDDATTLTVTAGRVTVTRRGGGSSIDVVAGQRLVSRAGSPFRLERTDVAVWSEDFEHGLPAGWRLGRFVKTGLPGGSHGGVEAVTARVQEGVYHTIAGPERWEDGLFRFENDLHVRVTLKMSRPGWLNVFLFSKKNSPGKPAFAGNFLFNEVPFLEMKPGRWYSLTIPITKFRRLFPTDGGQFDGVMPYQLAFSSKGESRGLVIDELRITRGGPGDVEWKEIESQKRH